MSVARNAGLAIAVRRSAALVAVAAIVGGCGGSDESAVEGWATDVCTAASEWREALRTAGEDLRAGPTTKDDLGAAGEEITEATEDLAEKLRDLGPPDTEAGEDVQRLLDQLVADVEQAQADVQSEVAGASGVQGALDAATAVASSLAAMGAQLQSTLEQIRQLDAAGELSDAFESSDACSSLTDG